VPSRRSKSWWATEWLARIAGRDAVERRQAYLLQAIILVIIGVFLIATVGNAIRAASGGAPANPIPNLTFITVSVVLLLVLRRGHFRPATGFFVAFLIYAFAQSLAGTGLTHGGPYLALLMVPLVIAGLLLPRLWLAVTAVAVYLAAFVAVQSDPLLADPSLPSPMGNFLFATIFVWAVVDQFGGTVRHALLAALAHEQELERGRESLAERTTELQAAVASLQAEMLERQRLEKERETIQERMLESQRLESIGRLAGGVAHDFNNLLTAIIGYSDLATTRPTLDDAHDDLRGVRHAADQAAALTRQLLAFSRNQELRPSIVDLSEVVAHVDPLLRRLLGERVRLIVLPADDLWPVLVDPSQMEAVIVNLAVNARDAMESVGTLTIETGNVELDNDYVRTHAEVTPGPYAMVAVSDTGAGMDEETLARIFEPFFTTKALGQGTGLGLASVYGTVRQSGGHIWVYSEPGQGTIFKLYLPRTQVGPTRTIEPVAPAEPRRGDEVVLVAEDEDLVRKMVVAALQQRGYSVIAVTTGEDALREIDRLGAGLGVLLTDVIMPGISGIELLERARTIRPDLPAIFMSGYTASAMGDRQLPAAVTFLEKPFTVAQLDKAVRETLDG
jgi:two-component system cell cycle sensor histidine kinase/response regulator CckA